MSDIVPKTDFSKIEAVLMTGDLSRLTSPEKVSYYNRVCESVGLNPLTMPFAYIKLNGKEVLYATRAATEQLRSLHKVSIRITARELMGDVYVVTAQATNQDGRTDESTGAVPVAGLKGEALANAYLKAETKSKRRVTLSICGLGLLDEMEVDTIPGAHREPLPALQPQIQAPEIDDTVIEMEEINELDQALGAQEPSIADYVIRAGKNKGKKLGEVSNRDLNSFIDWVHAEQSKSNEFSLGPDAMEYYQKCVEFLSQFKGRSK